METISRPSPVGDLPAGPSAETDAFLKTLRSEQARFLDAIRAAVSLLGRNSGQMAFVAATHSRLTNQFFDAQRLIMTRRAEIDAEVERVAATTPCGATTAIAAADFRAGTVADVMERGAVESSSAVAQQGHLASLLDGWWGDANQQGQAEIARAQATMGKRTAQIEARRIGGKSTTCEVQCDAQNHASVAARSDGPWPPPPIVTKPVVATLNEPSRGLPAPVAAILDKADSVNLQTLLGMLADALDPMRTSAERSERTNWHHVETVGVAVERPRVDLFFKDLEPDEAFQQFWASGSPTTVSRRAAHGCR